MKYPQDFITAVKKEFPEEADLHKALEDGVEPEVGCCLEDNSAGEIDPENIVEMIDSGNCDALRAEAAKLLRRRQLYAQWLALWQSPDRHPMAG